MENISSEVVGIIYNLLPGFITASIFYILTSYIKPDPFERVIQALIFTVITKVCVIILKPVLLFAGNFVSLGVWTTDGELVLTIVIAIIMGVFVSWGANNDFPLWLFRKDRIGNSNGFVNWIIGLLSRFNLTKKTLHPTEWYSFFDESESEAILHLEGERRLLGELKQFPDSPEQGHFIVVNASWLLDDGTIVPIISVDKMLVSSKEVLRVEILKKEIDIGINEINMQYQPIYNLYKQFSKETTDDYQCSKTST